jgi:hypothetical protein
MTTPRQIGPFNGLGVLEVLQSELVVVTLKFGLQPLFFKPRPVPIDNALFKFTFENTLNSHFVKE